MAMATEAPLTVKTPSPMASEILMALVTMVLGIFSVNLCVSSPNLCTDEEDQAGEKGDNQIDGLHEHGRGRDSQGDIPYGSTPVAVTTAMMVMPKISIFRLTPAIRPETAKATVPMISKINKVSSMLLLYASEIKKIIS